MTRFVALLFLSAACSAPTKSTDGSGARTTNVEHLGYFGQHFHHLVVGDVAGPTVFPARRDDGGPVVGIARTWDGGVCFWSGLEPTQGTYDWSTLDRFVATAHENGADVLQTLGPGTPAWASARPDEPFLYGGTGGAAEPRDLQLWSDYLTALFTRYRGKIKYYELWNEPAFTSTAPPFFSGTPEALWALHQTAVALLRYIDPDAQFLGPSFTGLSVSGGTSALDTYLAVTGAAYCSAVDIAGHHFYTDTPEQLVEWTHRYREIIGARCGAGLPVWNTEAGFKTRAGLVPEDPLYADSVDPALLPGWLARSYVWGMDLGLERFIYYSYDGWSGLFTDPDTGALRPLGRSQQQIGAWLDGATFGGCARGGDGIYACDVTRSSGGTAHLVWSAGDVATAFVAPDAWGTIAEIEHLDGTRASAEKRTLDVTGEPMLVKPTTDDWLYDANASVAARPDVDTSCLTNIDYGADVLLDSPLGYYRFAPGSVAADASPHHADGAVNGAIGSVSGALAMNDDGAVAFTGAPGGFRLPSSISPWSADFTVELWVNVGSFATDTMTVYLGDYALNGLRLAPTFMRSDDLGTWVFRTDQSGGNSTARTKTYVRASAWHLLTLVRSGGTFALWLDGRRELTVDAMDYVPTPATSVGLHVGDEAGNPVRGAIDELAVYDHALSDARIVAHAQHGSGRCDLPPVEP